MDEGFMAEASRRERRCTLPCNMRPASTVWWRNGKIVKSSSPNRKKCGVLLTRGVRERSIEQSGARKRIGIDV